MQQGSNVSPPNLLLDLTRLIGRFLYGYLPTGIDRVTIAYAGHYMKEVRVFVYFKSQYAVFPYDVSIKLIQILSRQNEASISRWYIANLVLRGVLFSRFEKNIKGCVLLNTDHAGLDKPAYKKLAQSLELKVICVLHDLIPINYPEYCRAGDDKRHQIRINAMLTVAKGIIVNSQDTLNNLEDYAEKQGYHIPSCHVAHLGLPEVNVSIEHITPLSKPYFVMLSTIEPRKNHTLILHIWRELSKELGDKAPILVIIGRRGWECENIIDLLDRSVSLKDTVIELSHCGDNELLRYLKFAQALLLPSFVEGYGLPLIEALENELPVIASDLGVFKEVAGDIPEYIDPLDGKAWKDIIVEYTDNNSSLRRNQLSKMQHTSLPTWKRHFHVVDNFITSLC